MQTKEGTTVTECGFFSHPVAGIKTDNLHASESHEAIKFTR